MFNFKKNQIPEAELNELKKIVDLTNQYVLIAQGLETTKQIYIRQLLTKYGFDLNKNYNVDLKSGKINEVKKQPQPQK
jgi:hypothetical protein